MISLSFNPQTDPPTLSCDLTAGDSGLVDDPTLVTAVLVSLLTDRRAHLDDRLPDAASRDRRGWCGDALAWVDQDRIGSRLWLLSREKQTEETRRRAIEYAQEALAWMIADGAASDIDVSARWARMGWLSMQIAIVAPDGAVASIEQNILIGG